MRSTPRRSGNSFGAQARIPGRVWLFLGLLLALLIVGTLQVGLLTGSYAQFTLPIAGMDGVQTALTRLVPFDVSRGEEGVSVQGATLIGLLALIGLTAWRGLGRVDEGYNCWTWAALGLVALTLLVAALRLVPHAGGVDVQITGKAIGVAAILAGLWVTARRAYEESEVQAFLWETWRFVRQIFPLLVVGVFLVGALRPLIRPEWIESLAGSNTFLANLAGVVFGVFMYFPHFGGGADRQSVPQPGHASRAAVGLLDGRSGAEPAEHPDHGQRHRPLEGLGLCGLGGGIQHSGRPDLRRVDRWRAVVADRPVPGRFSGGTGGRTPGVELARTTTR